MKSYYLAITIKENDKFYSYCQRVSECENLRTILKKPNIIVANIYPKMECLNIVGVWNAGFKRDGKYLFDDPMF